MRTGLLILALLIALPRSAQDTTPVSESAFCVNVWYPSADHPGGYDTLMANLDVIDGVNPFWYTPVGDGSVQAVNGAEDAAQLAAWREAGLPVIPSIFSGLGNVISNLETRAAHIDAIVELVERMDYDGIDIDYEGFTLNTRDAFSEFIEGLSERLHANGRLLTIAVHPKASDEGAWEGAAAQDWTRIAPAVDVFTIMTYDHGGRNAPPQPIGPTPWTLDVLEYAASITDLSKVRMGLHFYGYTWPRGNPPATTINWEGVQRYIDSFKPEIQRDPANMEAFIDFKPVGLPRQVVYFADATSVAFKVEQALAAFPELGGVAIWGLGGEDPANWDVLRDLRPAACGTDEE
ncbi:MAG: hypothetical protein IPK52_10080 [Chloroflexi bacterium]|nr:hypothetical protein [Chloroflexota bacterium]